MKKKLMTCCAECGSSNVIYNRDNDQVRCQDCGMIFEELDESTEDKYENILDEDAPL